MPSAPMFEWLNTEPEDLWERVDRVTYGTADEDEDVLLLAHARVELRARWGFRPTPPGSPQAEGVIPFPDLALRKVG